MILGMMQPYFFPYIGYWQLINTVDKYVLCDDVNFRKGGWIHRNRVLINGEARMINIHMHGASQNKHINEIKICDDPIFKDNLIKTFLYCYKKAPFFHEVFPMLETIIYQREDNLARYLENAIRAICDYLNINTEIIVSSSIQKDTHLKRQDKVIHICRLLGADAYYNPIGGRILYSFEDFKNAGIKLHFLKTAGVQYVQFNNAFIENLSIIDVMMFNSAAQIAEILKQYELLHA